jgi:hypothetical protein
MQRRLRGVETSTVLILVPLTQRILFLIQLRTVGGKPLHKGTLLTSIRSNPTALSPDMPISNTIRQELVPWSL